MNLAVISVIALLIAIALSCFTQLNVGVLAIVFAWIIGVYLGGMPVKTVAGGFPADLFLTLAGVTLLFSQAQVNGTLGSIAKHLVRLCRGNAGLLPVMFFCFASALATIGPGNIATAALLAPAAMAAARRTNISPFLMAIMVGNGANSGSLSPFAPTGIIVNGLMDRIGLRGYEWTNWWNNFAAHAALAFAGYLLFGGWKLFARKSSAAEPEEAEPFQRNQWITIAVIAGLVLAVVVGKANIGMAAFAGAALLAVLKACDDGEAIRKMPWNTLVMVCGVTVLISLLEKTQGIELFASLIARISTPGTATAVVAFVTGLVSVYSSTSGVVLPAFLPVIPSLIEKLGGGDAFAIASAMNVGGHLVDVSPLSTIGALCLAGVTDPQEARNLFLKLMAWGLSMSVAGAGFSYVFFR
ncbi:MAG: C4-dicarboxylate ABC transporter [Candidatus Solibacter usitatus]|nr:C4-dicarboxylate ABC transporter [Candidatus Solibacter usitatus]